MELLEAARPVMYALARAEQGEPCEEQVTMLTARGFYDKAHKHLTQAGQNALRYLKQNGYLNEPAFKVRFLVEPGVTRSAEPADESYLSKLYGLVRDACKIEEQTLAHYGVHPEELL